MFEKSISDMIYETFKLFFRRTTENQNELYPSFPTRVSYIIKMMIFDFNVLSNTIDYY